MIWLEDYHLSREYYLVVYYGDMQLQGLQRNASYSPQVWLEAAYRCNFCEDYTIVDPIEETIIYQEGVHDYNDPGDRYGHGQKVVVFHENIDDMFDALTCGDVRRIVLKCQEIEKKQIERSMGLNVDPNQARKN